MSFTTITAYYRPTFSIYSHFVWVLVGKGFQLVYRSGERDILGFFEIQKGGFCQCLASRGGGLGASTLENGESFNFNCFDILV